MKGHNNSGNGGNTRGRQLYGIMIILAFGAAILGVMLLHKMRERRIYGILVKEKDHQLISLHILLQKERDHNKEAKSKIQEMKAKIYSIRTQKTDLESKISEMQSTISSLKEEQKTLETALEEKQNEIKFLRGKETEPHIENPQIVSLTETLKQKESEIQELKNRFENQTKIWSVSTDDPSTLALNSSYNFHNQETQRNKTSYEKNGDKFKGTKPHGLIQNEIKGGCNSNEIYAETVSNSAHEDGIATKEEIENLNLNGNDEGREMDMSSRGMQENSFGSDGTERESEYVKEERLRLRAKQQRRGIIRNRRFRIDVQQNGKYKRIIDKELHKLGMHQGEVETGQDHKMGGKNRRIDVNKQTEKIAEINSTNGGVEEMQMNRTPDVLRNATSAEENSKKPDEVEIFGKNVNGGVQVRLETNGDDGVYQNTEEENTKKKNIEAEDWGDYGVFRAEQEENKIGSGEETDEPEF